jgi:Protein of unknown function (DUF2800)
VIERFSASVASRHIACHASADLETAIPGWAAPIKDPTADNAANRGTQTHELFAKVMNQGAKDLEKFSEAVSYIATLRQTRRFKVLIEEPIIADWLITKPGTTADLVLYTKDELHVIDLKTGKIPVPVFENEQLMYYAVSYGHLAPSAKGVTMHIIQPWADIMDSWYADSARLQLFMQEARDAEMQIHVLGDHTFSPSNSCTFCPANPHSRVAKGSPLCPVLMDMYYPKIVDDTAILSLED